MSRSTAAGRRPLQPPSAPLRLTRSALGALLAGVALLSACVPHKMYRTESVESGEGHRIAFVELDDFGELWDDRQLERALELVREPADAAQGAVVVLFVHGWNHDASPKDEDVQGFRELLTELAAEERRSGDAEPRPVVGVYVGWRGQAVRMPVFPVSFFNRLAAAERIASATATELIYRVASAGKENERSKVVLLGHSFGALILEQAVVEAMVGAVLDESGQRAEVFPADAVILLNSASQAINAKKFVDTLHRNRLRLFRESADGERRERPLLVSATSAGDWATRLLFPLWMGVKGLTKNFRTYGDGCAPVARQSTLQRRTSGHTPALWSHLLTADDPGLEAVREAAQLEGLEGGFGEVVRWYDPLTRQPVFSFAGRDKTFTIKERPRAFNASPYWILRVPDELVPNHSDIFGVDTVRFIGALLAISGALERESRTVLVREEPIQPVELVARPEGGLIVLARDRRVYLSNGGELASPGCIPQAVDAADRIGLAFEGQDRGRAVVNAPRDPRGRRHRTELLDIELTPEGPVIAARQKLRGEERFIHAAFDFAGGRIFLGGAEPGALWVVDRGGDRKPRRFATLPDAAPPAVFAFDPPGERLLVADGLSGTLREVSTRPGEEPAATTVARDLGFPVGIALEEGAGLVYVTDLDSGSVWRLECPPGEPCGEREPLPGEARPGVASLVEVDAEGNVWVGGGADPRVVGYDRSGEPLGGVGSDQRSRRGASAR